MGLPLRSAWIRAALALRHFARFLRVGRRGTSDGVVVWPAGRALAGVVRAPGSSFVALQLTLTGHAVGTLDASTEGALMSPRGSARIRTGTVQGLSLPPLPVGLETRPCPYERLREPLLGKGNSGCPAMDLGIL